MFGGPVELRAAGENLLELLGLVVIEILGAAGDLRGHVAHGRILAGRVVVREDISEPPDVFADDGDATAVAALLEFAEETGGVRASLGPALVEVGLVGVQDAGAARPLTDQQLVWVVACARRRTVVRLSLSSQAMARNAMPLPSS
ncbi:hypothetical protein [Streptomyces sp. NPDC002078]